MKRSMVGPLFIAIAVLHCAPASASVNPIVQAMGNLRWGMDELALKSALKGKLKGDVPYVEFNGQATRWDQSPIAEEYTHGNDEAMLVQKDGNSEDYFFFIGGQLWKWVKLYPASAFGGGDFKRFSAKIQDRFGKGHEKQGEVNAHSGQSYSFVEFLDRNTRVRAVDKTKQSGKYALVFEAMDTVRALSSLRTNTLHKGGQKPSSAIASAGPSHARDDEDAAKVSSAKSSQHGAPVEPGGSSGKSKRSVFAGEQQGTETEAQYAARKKQAMADQREQQKRLHQRGEDAKKGKVLDELAGINDDDPLGGMH